MMPYIIMSSPKPFPTDWEARLCFHIQEAEETRRVVGQYLEIRRARHDGITAQVTQAAGLFAALQRLNTQEQQQQQRVSLAALCSTIQEDSHRLTCAIDVVKGLRLLDEAKMQSLVPLDRMFAGVEAHLVFWHQRPAQLAMMATPLDNVCRALDRTSKDLQVIGGWLQGEERKCERWATCLEGTGEIGPL